VEVIDHESQFWFLLQDSADLLLDVSCEHSFIGYTFLMKLNQEEVDGYRGGGRDHLTELATKINFSAPIARGSASPYKSRNIQSLRGDEALVAVSAWREKRGAS
jgi:hypothetical protein